jgi:hypothetical protein
MLITMPGEGTDRWFGLCNMRVVFWGTLKLVLYQHLLNSIRGQEVKYA